MDPQKIRKLDEELKNLELFNGFLGSALINRNGLLITSRLPRNIDDRKFGAISATMFGAMETAAQTYEKNEATIYHLTVELKDIQLIILGVNDQILIMSLLENNVNLGLFLIEVEQLIKRMNFILLEE
jgi:predicted regulator of Ras-like GTPase activity (Roadblock/LC7/MglB family)